MTSGCSSRFKSVWAITSDGSDSLAVTEGYVDALGDDTVNSGLMYADVGSMLSSLDPMLTRMAPEYAAISPYAAAVDRMVVVGTVDADELSTTRMTGIVDQ